MKKHSISPDTACQKGPELCLAAAAQTSLTPDCHPVGSTLTPVADVLSRPEGQGKGSED